MIADAVRIERLCALAAPEGSPSQESSVKGQELQPSQLLPIVDAAIDRLVTAGFAADLFNNVVVAIADLPGATLGLAAHNTITIDVNAAGYGWAVSRGTRAESQEPEDSDEYSGSGLSTLDSRLHMDLLTVVMHELGHVAGLEDLDDLAAEDDLMYGWLEAGVRKTSLEASLADEAFSQF